MQLDDTQQTDEPQPWPSGSSEEFSAPPPLLTSSGRRRRLPKGFADFVPSSLTGLPRDMCLLAAPAAAPVASVSTVSLATRHMDTSEVLRPSSPPRQIFLTEPDEFGVFRAYSRKPKRDPEEQIGPEDLFDSRNIDFLSLQKSGNPLCSFGLAVSNSVAAGNAADISSYADFSNPSMILLLYWKYSGSNIKYDAELDRLVHGVIRAPEFDPSHFSKYTSMTREERRLDDYCEAVHKVKHQDGWKNSSVRIKLPMEGVRSRSESEVPVFEVKGGIVRFWRSSSQRTPTTTALPFTPFPLNSTVCAPNFCLPPTGPPPTPTQEYLLVQSGCIRRPTTQTRCSGKMKKSVRFLETRQTATMWSIPLHQSFYGLTQHTSRASGLSRSGLSTGTPGESLSILDANRPAFLRSISRTFHR